MLRPTRRVKLSGTVTGTFFTVAFVKPYGASVSWNAPFRLKEKFTVPAFVTPFFRLAFSANLFPPPSFALPLLFRVKVWVAPPTSTLTGMPCNEIPAAMVTLPFHWIVSTSGSANGA